MPGNLVAHTRFEFLLIKHIDRAVWVQSRSFHTTLHKAPLFTRPWTMTGGVAFYRELQSQFKCNLRKEITDSTNISYMEKPMGEKKQNVNIAYH